MRPSEEWNEDDLPTLFNDPMKASPRKHDLDGPRQALTGWIEGRVNLWSSIWTIRLEDNIRVQMNIPGYLRRDVLDHLGDRVQISYVQKGSLHQMQIEQIQRGGVSSIPGYEGD
jgi:hypothetical protein